MGTRTCLLKLLSHPIHFTTTTSTVPLWTASTVVFPVYCRLSFVVSVFFLQTMARRHSSRLSSPSTSHRGRGSWTRFHIRPRVSCRLLRPWLLDACLSYLPIYPVLPPSLESRTHGATRGLVSFLSLMFHKANWSLQWLYFLKLPSSCVYITQETSSEAPLHRTREFLSPSFSLLSLRLDKPRSTSTTPPGSSIDVELAGAFLRDNL